MHTLKNDILTIEVSAFGAELQSIRKGDIEYLWQGDPAYWGRRSPVLFPIVGSVWEKKYRVDGKEYEAKDGAYIYAPAGVGLQFKNTGDSEMKALLYKQIYIPCEGCNPYVYYGNTNDIEWRIYDDMENVFIKDLLPVEIHFDMNVIRLGDIAIANNPFETKRND